MRRGEILALQWGDIALDAPSPSLRVEETREGLRLKPPKTKRGRRTITLPPDTVAVLRAVKIDQMQVRLAIGLGKIEPDTLVFSTVEGGLLSPDNLSRDWRRTVIAKKLPRVSFHALRHTHASVLLNKGVDVITVSRRLGHSKPSVTLNRYGHAMTGADEAAAKAIGEVLK